MTGQEILMNEPTMNKRRLQIDAIIDLIMTEIEDLMPYEAKREVQDRLRHLMDLNGFHIMTDADRAALGLEPMDHPQGWTKTDRMKARAERDAKMFAIVQAINPSVANMEALTTVMDNAMEQARRITGVSTITGSGPTHERTGKLADEIKDLCYAEAERAPFALAAIIGALEIVKHQMLNEHAE